MNISNELISSVLGCECESHKIKDYNGFNRPTYKILSYVVDDIHCEEIPLDFFIHKAKIWAFKKGYEIIEECDCVEIFPNNNVLYLYKYHCLYSFSSDCTFSQKTVIIALEWIQKEVSK